MSDTVEDLVFEELDADEGLARVLAAAKSDGSVASTAEDWFGCVSRVLICNEPVKLSGNVALPSEWDGAAVIFAKGLEVDGMLEDSGGEDCVVCVIGDLAATRLYAMVYWLVTGNVTIADSAVGSGSHDYLMELDGEGRCDTLVERDYALGFHARVAVKADGQKDMRDVLVGECLDEQGVFDPRAAARLMREGKPLARA